MKSNSKFLAVRVAIAAIFLFGCVALATAQSAPGYQAPAKPAAPEESLQSKARRGQAPLRKLYDYLRADSAKTKRLPALSVAEKSTKAKNKALRTGTVRPLATPLDPISDAAHYRVAEGDVRVMGIVSEGALYVRVQLAKMDLPAGARVFVYSAVNPDEFYGPFDGRGVDKGTVWTPPIKGDSVVIEYFAPLNATVGTPFKVLQIAHVFLDPLAGPKVGGCHNEVADPWTDTAKATGRLDFVSGGSTFSCTGTLMADNVSGSDIPYLLTANHCFDTQAEANTLTVYWNFNNVNDTLPSCPANCSNGATLLATGTTSDFTFVRLNSVPGGLFFSGWDASVVSPSTAATGIHHPDGSHKRITFVTTNSDCLGLPCSSFIGVTWNPGGGSTEGGSSGSGLWIGSPPNAKLVGTLTGGDLVCTPNGKDVYGRFSTTYPSISAYLEGTNCVTSLNPTSLNFTSSGGPGIFTVNAPGGCNWTAVASDSWITVTPPANGTGNSTVNFSVAANGGAQRSGSITVGGQIFSVTQGSGGSCGSTPISFGQTIDGTLTNMDCPHPGGDGTFYDTYTFSGTAGQQILILMNSGAFDTFLYLFRPDGTELARDDDGQTGTTNSRIPTAGGFLTLPTTGTYTIWANSFLIGPNNPGFGNYSITLNASAPVTRTLTVASLTPNSGVTITVSPNDNGGLGNGTTQFSRTYNNNVTVNLTAPPTAGGNAFLKWQRDGVDLTNTQATSVVMDANHTMTAVYAPPRTLTVASLNPNSGVSITVSPIDNSFQGNGTTQFTRTYNNNTTVTLTAPGTTSEGNLFRRWLMNGSEFNGQLNAIVTLTADTTMTAEYSIKPKIYGEENNASAAAAINSVTFLRGPFQILTPNNFAADGQTRIIIFTNDLGLTNPPLNDAAVLRVEANGTILPIEAYGSLSGVPGLTGSYIVVKLAGVTTGPKQLVVWLFGHNSDPKTITIN